mgnify:FL=1
MYRISAIRKDVMHKIQKSVSIGRKCRFCKEEIMANISQDEDGYFVTETCACGEKGYEPRKNACDIPEYEEALKRRIESDTILLQEISKIPLQ